MADEVERHGRNATTRTGPSLPGLWSHSGHLRRARWNVAWGRVAPSPPAPGWLACVFTTRFVTDGVIEEDGEIWDSEGHLVAQGRQLALVPRPTGKLPSGL
ncbi:MAG: hypothetical protein WAW08_15430 [Candidatus Microthrix parvicella]